MLGYLNGTAGQRGLKMKDLENMAQSLWGPPDASTSPGPHPRQESSDNQQGWGNKTVGVRWVVLFT